MGHYEREIIDYNPVTDKNYYGDLKYVEDENDKREAYERRRREDQERNIRIYIDNIRSSSDYEAIRKAREAIENASALSRLEKSDWTWRLNASVQSWERIEKNERNAEYERSKKEREEREKERKERKEALEAAKKRYKSLSFFKKIKYFKNRPSKIDVYQQTSEEINQLYRRR